MKFLLGIVSVVAVFTANGQDFHKKTATGDTPNDVNEKDLYFQGEPQNLLDELKLQDIEKNDQQLTEKRGEQDRVLKKLRCKARNSCVVMGGFCVTNATLCSGRLVPEGCKGTNCQCCVPGTFEAKFMNLEQELLSIKANMNTELHSIKDNMKNISSNLRAEFEYLKTNMNNSDFNINIELDSIQNEMNNSNTDFQNLKKNLNTSFLNVNRKLENQGCPDGTFLFPQSNQCFRILNDTTRTWLSADTACRSLGLRLAMPYDPISLRSYLVTKYGRGIYSHTWLGARGDGSYIRWQRTGEYISSSNPLWYSGRPGSYISTSYCLALMTYESVWKSYPNQPYNNAASCTGSLWTLCEWVAV